jgi:hypothetical protein
MNNINTNTKRATDRPNDNQDCIIGVLFMYVVGVAMGALGTYLLVC